MSESISQDHIDAAVARDRRLAVVLRGIAIEADLRDNPTIKAILDAVRADAEAAMEELADTSPENKVNIADLLVRIRAHVYIRRGLNVIRQRANAAEQSIAAEDQRQEDE